MAPRAAIVCPAGFTITKLKYKFSNGSQSMGQPNVSPIGYIQHEGEDSNLVNYHTIMLSEEEFTHLIDYEKLNHGSQVDVMKPIVMPQDGGRGMRQVWAGARNELGPCPTLVYCIGHQACLFHYGNKFCQNDPSPGNRKQLDIRVYCNQDEIFETFINDFVDFQQYKPKGEGLFENISQEVTSELISKVQSYPQKTTFIKYESIIDGSRSPLFPPIQSMINEEEVFNITCPLPLEIHSSGYRGNCYAMQRNRRQISDDLWSRLGREACGECRRQILETYCAYMYNLQGDCLPPYVLDQSKSSESASGIGWSSVAMPDSGARFNLSSYYQVLTDPVVDLIPVRLAFFIMAHESAPATVQLLQQIYHPDNYYVIIMDIQANDARVEIQKLVNSSFSGSSNIRVLPQQRSFASSWGSWIIQRAQLECYEELVRMGVWDFAIYLSGRDLPIRKMEDLALMLAPYRGKNMIRINGKLNLNQDPPATTVWQSCNRHVYNLTARAPKPGLELWSHSNFGIYSRDYVEFILSSQRGYNIDRVHFYIQTSFIPDELYMGSLLYHSTYKKTSVTTGLHFTKPFAGEDSDNLCRHQEETDTCGRGPPDFKMEDVPLLTTSRHSYFFSRKYSTDARDATRLEVIKLTSNTSYYDEINKYMPPALQMRLAEKSLLKLTGKSSLTDLDVENIQIDKIQLVPKLVAAHPCCIYRTPSPENPLIEYRLILHFTVTFSRGKQSSAIANVDLDPGWSHSCYPGGHIQALYVTTREAENIWNRPPQKRSTKPDMKDLPKHIQERMEKEGMLDTNPGPQDEGASENLAPVLTSLPTVVHPFRGQVLYLNFILSTDLTPECKASAITEGMFGTPFLRFDLPYNLLPQMGPPQQPDPQQIAKYDIPAEVTIYDSSEEVIYEGVHAISKGMLGERSPQGPKTIEQESSKMQIRLNGRYFREGKYTVTVKRQDDPSGFIYKQSFVTIDESNMESYLRDDVLNNLNITNVAWQQDMDGSKYYVNVPVQDEKAHAALVHVPLRDRLTKADKYTKDSTQFKLKSMAASYTAGQSSSGWRFFLFAEYLFIIVFVCGAFFIYRYRVREISKYKREKGKPNQITAITRKQALRYSLTTAIVYHLLVFIYYVMFSSRDEMFEAVQHDEM